MTTLMKRDYICVSVFYVLFVALFSIGTACSNQSSSSNVNNKTSSSYGSGSYSAQSDNSNSNKSNHYDDSSTKWEEFAGTTYRASQWVSDRMQYYAFSYNRSGKGKYFIYCNYPSTNVVEDQMEFSIYKVESEGNYLYLYSYELNSPVKIKIQGSSLYTMNGDRYEIWR